VAVALVSFDEVEHPSVQAWCENALVILAILRKHPDKVPFRIPTETLLHLEEIVTEWRFDAMSGHMPAPREYGDDELRQLILYWFNITKLTEEERDRLGIRFTPPAGRAFADALAAAVGGAMVASPALTAFADRLEAEWQECQPGFADGRRR
jgi:hypothetical protein